MQTTTDLRLSLDLLYAQLLQSQEESDAITALERLVPIVQGLIRQVEELQRIQIEKEKEK